ncbi:MAG: T9SS type A sorting domain-containing protein [Bacteroidetes bacterium]|nr:T9SS type A sorting domain-containing protein [Bacteroidota bacterium]
MLKYLFSFLLISFFLKSQTVIDDLIIYQNPFQNSTSITYSFINNDTVSIVVYNVVGNAIYTPITNSVMPSGIYQDSLIMGSYPDGIYFVHLKLSNRKTIAKKIIKSNTANIISNQNSMKDITFYPNPTNDKLFIKYSGTNDNKISIFDVIGKLCLKSENQPEIDISQLPSGFYYLQFQNESGKTIFKIIKE